MARSGINKRVLERFGGEVLCFMSDVDVANEAKERGVTRATVSMERAARLKGPLILALGNAPTALVRACELMEAGELRPALVPYIVARGRKGGSNVAACICNAMLYLASGNARE